MIISEKHPKRKPRFGKSSDSSARKLEYFDSGTERAGKNDPASLANRIRALENHKKRKKAGSTNQ